MLGESQHVQYQALNKLQSEVDKEVADWTYISENLRTLTDMLDQPIKEKVNKELAGWTKRNALVTTMRDTFIVNMASTMDYAEMCARITAESSDKDWLTLSIRKRAATQAQDSMELLEVAAGVLMRYGVGEPYYWFEEPNVSE